MVFWLRGKAHMDVMLAPRPKLLATAFLLAGCVQMVPGVVKRRSAQHWEVEYEDYELPDNETGIDPPRGAQESIGVGVYGFDIAPCLALGCSEEMLNNAVCDEPCNNLQCDYDLATCFKYFDYHGYGWDFDGCSETGCTSEQLFNMVCDNECNSDVCHYDNWRCVGHDEYELYDVMGNGWDDDLQDCFATTGCTEVLLFNQECDEVCNSELCHYDNWKCYAKNSAQGDVSDVFKDDL